MALETILEIVSIKQVTNELEGGERFQMRCPEDVASVAKDIIGDEDREIFLVICLSTKNDVVAIHRAHVGTINVHKTNGKTSK